MEAMQHALYELYEANEPLYSALMETYSVLYLLGDESLNGAQAANILATAYLTQAEASATP